MLFRMTPEDERMNRELKQRFESRIHHFASPYDLTVAFHRSRDRLVSEIRKNCPKAKLHEVGPDQRRSSDWWSCVIEVESDATRDRLKGDDELQKKMLSEAQAGGFPPHSIEFESRETVSRDYAGNWFFRLR
jgi:hypothetical protein